MTSSERREEGGEINPGFVVTEEPHRKVSICSDAIQAEEERYRKISGHSDGRRKTSILVNGEYKTNNSFPSSRRHSYDNGRAECEERDKHSCESLGDKDDVENSWWFLLCTKCRQKETGHGWEPPFWQRFFPYPFCPTYRHMARVLALFIVGLLAWGVVYTVVGKEASPGGQLFDIAVLCILAHLGGWLFRLCTMPPLVGMLLVGIIYQNIGLIYVHGQYNSMVAILRKMALVVILTRAGLDLDPNALRRLCLTVLRMGLIPWLVECLVMATLTHYLMGLPWIWGLLLGSIVAAVSPAVVVPCLFRLRVKGYGVAKGIPTLIIAVSGIDDAFSVAAFGIIHSIMFSTNSLAYNLVLGPLSIAIGIAYGLVWGYLVKYVPEKGDPFVIPLRILMLFGGGLIAVFGSEMVDLGGAGPLGCIAAAFLSSYVWSTQGWEIEDNPVATAFEIFWMLFEPILFALTGTQIVFAEMDPHTFNIGLACLVAAIVLRMASTCLVAIGAKLNIKEKLFISLSWMAKASVQAALAPVALDSVRSLGAQSSSEYEEYARVVLLVCIMSIILTAPVGAILITITGSRLLTKTTAAPVEGWRRSARPSIRDISIIDEEDEEKGKEDDADEPEEKRTQASPEAASSP